MLTAEQLVARRIASFAATLRDAGFAAGIGESEDAARILASPLARRPTTLRPALRALFASTRADWQRFDEIFDAAFLGRRLRSVVRSAGAAPAPGPRTLRELAAGRDGTSGAPEATAGAAATGAGTAMREGASAADRGAARDMNDLDDPASLAAAQAVAETLWTALHARRARGHRRDHRGRRLDLRRTIRASLARGGTPLDLAWRRPRRTPFRVALLLDVSGSMSVYTTLSVRLALGMLRCSAKATAFMFHTRLVEISDALRDRNRPRALDRLTLLAKGVGGGTRIGECLAAFNRAHAPRALAGRSVCFIVSDGYETGAPEQLGREMAALRRRCRRIVWLNPLADDPGYQPTARGMQAALPYLRIFAPAGSLDSLAALAPRLERL